MNTNKQYKAGQVPSKFLNVYDFGMKMYTCHPITAELLFQGELWLVESRLANFAKSSRRLRRFFGFVLCKDINAKILRSYEDFISPLELNKKHSKSNISVMEVYYQIIFLLRLLSIRKKPYILNPKLPTTFRPWAYKWGWTAARPRWP